MRGSSPPACAAEQPRLGPGSWPPEAIRPRAVTWLRGGLLTAGGLFGVGCSVPPPGPTPAELRSADYGARPHGFAERIVADALRRFDQAAHVEVGTPFRGWFGTDGVDGGPRDIRFGWLVRFRALHSDAVAAMATRRRERAAAEAALEAAVRSGNAAAIQRQLPVGADPFARAGAETGAIATRRDSPVVRRFEARAARMRPAIVLPYGAEPPRVHPFRRWPGTATADRKIAAAGFYAFEGDQLVGVWTVTGFRFVSDGEQP